MTNKLALLFFTFFIILKAHSNTAINDSLSAIIESEKPDKEKSVALEKLAFNAILAALIFPLHAFFESRLKKRIVLN